MAKKKISYTRNVEPYLDKVNKWANSGLTDEEIAYYLGITYSALQRYKRAHTDFEEAIEGPRTELDKKVEDALYKRAIGYKYKEKTWERKLDPETGEYALVLVKTVLKHVLPDTTAQQFWLTNRKPEVWKHKPTTTQTNTNQEAIDNWINATKMSKGAVSNLFDSDTEELQ